MKKKLFFFSRFYIFTAYTLITYMKKFYLSLLALAFLFTAIAQQTTFRTQYNLGLFDIPTGMVQAPGGGNYVFSATTQQLLGVQGALVEVNLNGNHVRSSTFSNGFFSDVDLEDVKNSSAGGYIATGSAGGQCLLIKTTATFGVTWSKRYLPVSGASAAGSKVIQTSDGGYLVAGSCSKVDPDGAGAIARQDSSKMFALKVDASGNVSWTKVFFYTTAFDDDDYLSDVVETTDGYAFIGAVTTVAPDGNNDAVIIKTDKTGALQWANRFGADDAQSVMLDAANNIVITGINGVSVYLLNVSAPNSGPTVTGTNSTYVTAGLAVSAGNLTKTFDNNFALFGSGATFSAFTTIVAKVDRNTGAQIFAKSYNSFISILPTGIQAADSGFLMNSLSADTGGGGGYDFAITKTDINGNQGASATCPATNATFVRSSYSPTFTAFTPTIVTTNTSSNVSLTASSVTPGVVINCRVIACTAPATPTVAASANNICPGTATTISASGGSNVTYHIYTQASGGTSVGDAPKVFNPNATTTYWVEADDNNNPGCVSPRASVTVTVIQPPAAVGAISGATSPCTGQQNYTITAVSGANNYTWSVSGGGTISGTGTTATAQWNTAGGPYTVSVTANGTCGTTSNTLQVTVLGSVSGISASASPNPACAGANVTLTGGGNNVTTWSWTGPNSYTSSLQSPVLSNVQTNQGGLYTLTASNGCGSNSASTTLVVNNVPQSVSAAANPNPACAGNTVTLTGTATGATSYSWSGPNSFTASTQNTSVVNAQSSATGLYTFTATNGCGNTSGTVNVTVNDIPLSVTATANPTAVCAGTALSLSGSATGATTYAWSGPAGFTSAQLNNTINNFQAANAGTYTLVATNSCGNAQSTVNVTLINSPANTTATANLTNICNNATLSLSGSSTGATWWSWAGPNGFSSTLQNPTVANITLADSGLYTLTATNICGSATASVNVDVDAPILNLTVNANPNDTLCAGSTINLSGSGTQVNTWSWTGPNGFNSFLQNPSIPNSTTAATGTYTVTAANACGTQTASLNVVVNNAIGTLTATATSGNNICNGANISLSAGGANVTGFSWTGPNNFTSTQQNPVITNAPVAAGGTYTVTANNACGSQNASVSVQVDTTITNLTSSATPNDTICTGGTLSLNASGTNVNSWSWAGPNGFSAATQNTSVPNATAAASGTYTVTATNACGSQTATINALVNNTIAGLTATAATGVNICNGTNLTLNATGTNVNEYSWTGPNGFTSNQQNPTINNATVAASGVYTVTGGNGCGNATATITIQIDTLIENVVAATSTGDTICAGSNINLTASGTNVNTWSWTGPNGFTSALQNPTIAAATTAASGNYILTATNACGTAKDTVTVLVNATPLTPSAINGSATTCGNDTATYSISSVPGATNYTWTLSGGGSIISGQGTTSIDVSWGSASGTYTVSVTAANNCGGSTASTLTVNLQAPAPVMNAVIAGDTGVCPGNEVYTISAIANATSYTWTANSGTITGGQGTTSVTINWSNTGTQTVSVVATNTCGNSSAATLSVNVHPSPTAPTINLQNNTTTICEGTSATITATNSTGGTVAYNFYDAATGGNLVGTSPLTVTPTITTTYYLEVINEFGCTNSAGRIPVTVNVTQAPTVLGIDAGNDTICYNTATTLTANVSPQGTTVTWYDQPTGGTLLASSNTYTTGNLTQNTVVYAQATSAGGCQNLQGRVAATVTVSPLTVVTLTSDKEFNTIFPNEVINFTAVPDTFSNYEFFWNGTSVQNGPLNTWGSSKINNLDSVWVIANNGGCLSARSLDTVYVVDFPNAFTPNNDGVNDVFLKDYDLVITNRWGQTLYQGRDGWDGRYKGDKVSPGTYYYVVMLDNITDRKNAIKGTVLLIED